MKDLIPALSMEHENIARAMLTTRGDLTLASRDTAVSLNAMALRREVQDCPAIRVRYHELLTMEMQESGLHIAERILGMVALQKRAYGGEFDEVDVETGELVTMNLPPDPKMAIELSKEISRLIMEGKGVSVSNKSAIILTSKEDAAEILAKFLDGQ